MKASGNKQIFNIIQEYLTEANNTIDLFMDTMTAFLKGADCEVLENFAREVRISESACDKYRRELKTYLYSSSMPSEVRRDWQSLIDLLDKVPNKAEHVSNFISLTGPQVPKIMHGDIKEILLMTLKCTSYLFSSVDELFNNPEKAYSLAKRVEFMENAVDKLERQVIRRIFKSDLDMGSKMLHHKLIEMICSIADRAENASDSVKVLSIRKDNWGQGTLSRIIGRTSII